MATKGHGRGIPGPAGAGGEGPAGEAGKGTSWRGPTITRRTVLKGLGLGAVDARWGRFFKLHELATGATALFTDPYSPAESFRVAVSRRGDFLNVTIVFYNLQRKDQVGGPVLVREDSLQPAFISVVLPPQHMGEEAFDPPNGHLLKPPGSVAALPAGPSRLVFRVPAGLSSIPYNLKSLLTFTDFVPSISPKADPTKPKGVLTDPPLETETALEVPWRLVVSPEPPGRWLNPIGEVTRNGRTEIWHARLGQVMGGQIVEPPDTKPKVRAIWSPDVNNPTDPIFTTLSGSDRDALVKLMANAVSPVSDILPAEAEQLILTSLGATVNVHGAWNDPAENLVDWRHQASMGRDTYVRVIYRGYAFPLGLRMALIKVTERRFTPNPGTGQDPIAYLFQQQFSLFKQFVKDYGSQANPYQPNDGRKFPFRRIRVTTRATPPLVTDIQDPGLGIAGFTFPNAFWMRYYLNGTPTDVQFHVVVEDWDGQPHDLNIPLVFVTAATREGQPTYGWNINQMNNAANAYKADPRSHVQVGGDLVSMAETAVPGDSALQTDSLDLGAETPAVQPPVLDLFAKDLPAFSPTVEKAQVKLPGPEQISATSLGPTEITLNPNYVKSGFPDPPGSTAEIFADVATVVPLGFPSSDRAGGVAAPNFGIDGISRGLGPVGSASTLEGGSFDPASFFGQALDLPKFLGVIDVATIVNDAAVGSAGWADKLPKVTTETFYPNGDTTKVPEAVQTTMGWDPEVHADGSNLFVPDSPTGTLSLTVVLYTPVQNAPKPMSTDIIGDLRNFTINVLDGGDLHFLSFHLNRFRFISKNGSKPDFDVEVGDVAFDGPLAFINALQEFLKTAGVLAQAPPKAGTLTPAQNEGSAGPGLSVDVTTEGITATFTLPIPTVAVGVFSMQNMTLSTGLSLFFNGDPARIRFAFCTRENPFILTVTIFGGGGFVGVGLGLDGLELVEASLEFGGNFAFDIGVASGGLHILAGVYFKLEPQEDHPDKDEITLTGYIRAGGELEVLGIISLSIEFYLALEYKGPSPEVVTGEATVTMKVEVLCFSAEVEATMKKTLAGGDSAAAAAIAGGGSADRPLTTSGFTFADVMTQQDWNAYSSSFASE